MLNCSWDQNSCLAVESQFPTRVGISCNLVRRAKRERGSWACTECGRRGVKRGVPCQHVPSSFVPTVLRAVPVRLLIRAMLIFNRAVPCPC